MLEAATTPPETVDDQPDKVSGVWRMVLIVVSVQLVLIAAGMVLFSAMGLANDGTGSCGGG